MGHALKGLQNVSMESILGNREIFNKWGVFAANRRDPGQLKFIVEKFGINAGFSAEVTSASEGNSFAGYPHASICLGHHDTSDGVVSILGPDGKPYQNNGRYTREVGIGSFDPVYLLPNHSLRVDNGMFDFLRIGSLHDDEGGKHTHLARISEYPVDPVQPEFGCGDKYNWMSMVSRFNSPGDAMLPKERLGELPHGKLRPNGSHYHGAHLLHGITASRVHAHAVSEFYWGGGRGDHRGLLFVYDDALENYLALELNPDTLIYLGLRENGMTPFHGAVAVNPTTARSDGLKGCPVWVYVPGGWHKEVIVDKPSHLQAKVIEWENYGGGNLPMPLQDRALEGRLARPQDQERVAEVIKAFRFDSRYS